MIGGIARRSIALATLASLVLAASFLVNLVAPIFTQLAVTVAVTLLGVMLILLFLKEYPTARKSIAATFAAGMMLIHVVNWNTRVAFVRDLYSLKPGMTIAQANERMARYSGEFPQGPIRSEPTRNPVAEAATRSTRGNWLVFTHASNRLLDDHWDADVGMVFLNGDRVEHVEFWPD